VLAVIGSLVIVCAPEIAHLHSGAFHPPAETPIFAALLFSIGLMARWATRRRMMPWLQRR
jgi:hypothetical protein